MLVGESPVECARRETMEETNLLLRDEDIQFFAYVSEKEYFGTGNWLMFLFDSRVTLDKLPNDISEGTFAFFGVMKLIISKSLPRIINWYGLFMTRKTMVFGVFEQIFQNQSIKLRLKHLLIKEIMFSF